MTDNIEHMEWGAVCEAPFGWVAVAADEAVRQIQILIERPEQMLITPNVLASRVCRALQAWFAGGDWPQGIPLRPGGTPYQKRVWQALQNIPVGQTQTYGELAALLDSGSRAIGGACRKNPLPLLVPCHRVVAANGSGGFAGHTSGHWLAVKHWLLEHER